ncbi:MAG: ABC transporter permease subunit [Treponema sp.]|jgi:putative aldouronate transport system permease protein|nr:ABC transporter permease subunit [Treponema sp.]
MTKFKDVKGNIQLWLMVLPALAYIVIFCYVPMYGIQLAFRAYDFSKGITGGDWVGLRYFRQYFESRLFPITMRNTFLIALTGIVFGFPMPIFLALVMNQIKSKTRRKILQTTLYLPYFISTVVMVSIINIFLSQTQGILSLALVRLKFISPNINLLGSASTFIPVYVISGIWQGCGWGSIIYMAALSGVDPQLYDAARIDGANRLQSIRHVEIPAIMPTIVIMLILSMGGILSVGFEKVYLMQNPLNIQASEVISTYVYGIGMRSSQFSFGAAVGLFNTLINFTFLLLTNWVSRKVSDISLL